ncbi:Low complexity protein [Cryptosporidium ryanae]|uniref:Low complexity protein n=1 Tax=Cryptosporidium ryanae TaxID=515981 RepID=UPI00351A37B0|nr:Low complexity protein [Cryptosporidium ryanae]
MIKRNSQFSLPKKDSKKLIYLERTDILRENDEEVLNFDENVEEIDLCLDTFKIKEIIKVIGEVDLDDNNEVTKSFPSINYAIPISYLWNKLNSSDNKRGVLVFLLNLIQYFNSESRTYTSHNGSSLLNILVFCLTNILFQEFDLITAKIQDRKSSKFNLKSSNKIKKSRKKRMKSKYLCEESNDSESDHGISDCYENINSENDIQKKDKYKFNTSELCFELYRNLVETLSSNIYIYRNMDDSMKEWLVILSLRVANVAQTIDNIGDVQDEFFNNNWEEISEQLLVSIINSVFNQEDSCDHTNSDEEYGNKAKFIFEIILNCILNSSIDIISNTNNSFGTSNKNNQLNKNFGIYLSKIVFGIKEDRCCYKFVTYIFEGLELYWRKLDVISSFEEDCQFIATLSSFIDNISRLCPSVILNSVLLIRRILKVVTSYKLRSSFIISVTNSLINTNKSTENDSSNRTKIIETIDLLLERIYDSHQNCRTRTIQCLQRLMEANLIPYTFFISLLKEIKPRTLDESSYVRASSFNLLRIMIRKATENYYQLPLNYDYISTLIDSVQSKLRKINDEKITDVNEKILNNFVYNEIDNSENDKKEMEYELMRVLLSDAKEVSLVVESIIEEVCIHGIYSKTSSDVSSCILFICECASLNIVKGLNCISTVFKCIWRVNNSSILNSVIHGFYIIMSDGNSGSTCLEDQENEAENEQEVEDGKISMSRNCVKNIERVLLNMKEDDLVNVMRILELLSSINQGSNSNIISKKYTNNFDIKLLRKYTLDEIIELKDNIFENSDAEQKYISLIEFYTIILKVIVLNDNCLFKQSDNSFELFYDITRESIRKNNLSIAESTIKCLNLMEACDDHESELINTYFNILTLNINENGIHKHSLIFKVIDSVFMLLCNPSKIKFVLNNKNEKKVFLIDVFIKKLCDYYYGNYLGCLNELTLIKLSQIVLSLTHITFKYGNYIENLYNKWKQLYSIYIRSNKANVDKKNSECVSINLEEEYLQHIQFILEENLISNSTIFNMIIPVVNILSRDPSLIIDLEENENNDITQWQIDYSRNCSFISLCKLIAISTKLLNINQELLSDNNLNCNTKQSYIVNNIPNIQLIFTLLYNPESVGYISKNQLDDIRINIILATNDLLTRYPNIIDPWMDKQYSLINKYSNQNNEYFINNKNTVEYSIMLIINYLLSIGFIKPKDELLLNYLKCIYNKSEFNTQVSSLSNSFFQEFFRDLNNQLSTNVIPSLINHLSVEYSKFYDDKDKMQMIIQQMQYLLHFVSGKESACCTLIPKFMSRMSKINDSKSLEFYIHSLESLKINAKTKCVNKIVENINLVQFHIQEFNFVKQFFYKIVQNHVSTNASGEKSHFLSLFEDVNSEEPNDQLDETRKGTDLSLKNPQGNKDTCFDENDNNSNTNH